MKSQTNSGTQLWVRRSSYGVRRDQDLNFFQLFSTCFSCYQMFSNVHSLLQLFSPGFSGDQLFSTVVKWFHPASTVFSCSRLISNVPNWFQLLSTVFKFCHLFPNIFDPLHLSSSVLTSSGLFWFWMAWFQLCPLDLNCYHCGELRCTQDGSSDPEKLLQTNLRSRCQKSSKMRREKQIINSHTRPTRTLLVIDSFASSPSLIRYFHQKISTVGFLITDFSSPVCSSYLGCSFFSKIGANHMESSHSHGIQFACHVLCCFAMIEGKFMESHIPDIFSIMGWFNIFWHLKQRSETHGTYSPPTSWTNNTSKGKNAISFISRPEHVGLNGILSVAHGFGFGIQCFQRAYYCFSALNDG